MNEKTKNLSQTHQESNRYTRTHARTHARTNATMRAGEHLARSSSYEHIDTDRAIIEKVRVFIFCSVSMAHPIRPRNLDGRKYVEQDKGSELSPMLLVFVLLCRLNAADDDSNENRTKQISNRRRILMEKQQQGKDIEYNSTKVILKELLFPPNGY